MKEFNKLMIGLIATMLAVIVMGVGIIFTIWFLVQFWNWLF